ncbi:hypothetical protein GCM10017566_69070 [Amycolatopsis bartoniae]|uniref:Uncharacterized protein n=1 Tax=Amycolatopsis bartoniae TaxID=941986 RepID=A0A8H9MFB9_9PSEU|nr:hypothetical protein GCM10017566_69070 [Amycolatopsis bartoniae]
MLSGLVKLVFSPTFVSTMRGTRFRVGDGTSGFSGGVTGLSVIENVGCCDVWWCDAAVVKPITAATAATPSRISRRVRHLLDGGGEGGCHGGGGGKVTTARSGC